MQKSKIRLRPVTETEFQSWKEKSRAHYAAEKQKQGLSEEEAKAESEASFARNLPQGRDTSNHYIYSLVIDGSGEQAGNLWWGLNKQGSQIIPWVFDIELYPQWRGQGLGRQAMELAQADVKTKGFDSLGLHVFGHNKIARELYDSLGFRTTSIWMVKDLG